MSCFYFYSFIPSSFTFYLAYRSLRISKTHKQCHPSVYSHMQHPLKGNKLILGNKVNLSTKLPDWEAISTLGSSSIHGCKEEKDRQLGLEFQTVAWNIVEIFGRPNFSDFFPVLAWFDLQRVERDMKKQLQKMDQIFESVIEDRIKSNAEKSHGARDDEGKKDFLQILLDLRNQEDATSLNITIIKALLLDMMIAGAETTATIIDWTMAEIMKNHHVTKMIQEELAE
ncbi:hypothetical protein L1987_71153 [Smallanthus sonchifolius]|uniref:Uncharacterized protein n=1 Tax=Smallanthus sonchifolius TaxID=185202 RepID=A0ACB9AT86_9ASTR|nr:hypothetical protein L1987_71153 [Smallanthus sonchifolius]